MSRTFEYNTATRAQVPLLIGLVGPSGSGKTYSALRLATGIQKVTGGEIAVIDTESRRALHYADLTKFNHVPFDPPHGPLDYIAAIEHCVAKGAKTIVIDSASHEHEGIGGVLEMHQAEVERLSRGDSNKANKVKMLAWSAPKQARRKFINRVLQLPINCIFCFRAKQKLKIVPGKEPEELGWMAIAGEEMIYEMTANCLLLPKSGGVPAWSSNYPGERATMKLPRQFQSLFEKAQPLSEDIGREMAEWAAGDGVDVDELIARYAQCEDDATLQKLEGERGALWNDLRPGPKKKLKSASDAAAERVAEKEAAA